MLLLNACLLRDDRLALDRCVSGCGGVKCADASYGLTIQHDLEIIASAGGEALQSCVVVAAVSAGSGSGGLVQVVALGAILDAHISSAPGGPTERCRRISHDFGYRAIGNLLGLRRGGIILSCPGRRDRPALRYCNRTYP